MSNKISNKDKKDWKEFISSSDKLINKDLYLEKKINKNINKTIDLHGFSLDNANKVVSEINSFGGRAYPLQADISNETSVNELIKTVLDKNKKIDVLVNNAVIT